jgi:predicted O-methyltransferase YrrM
MDPVEASQLKAILESLAPRSCLEWGAGGSTQTLLATCPFIEQYVSVEHNHAWHDRVKAAVSDPRLSLHFVAADLPLLSPKPSQKEIEAWDLRAELEPDVMASYVGLPRTLGRPFDFILVDGRARNFCVKEGYALLRSGGVIVVHDAQREEYRETLLAFPRPVFLTPWVQGQLWLVRKP